MPSSASPLDDHPDGTSMRSVTAEPGMADVRRGMRIRLAEDIARNSGSGRA